MRALVVYESMYGNTHLIADAIGAGIGGDVAVVAVDAATPELLSAAELLVVGGPTHVHGMSRPSTRASAVEVAEDPEKNLSLDPDACGDGVREWLAAMGDAANGHRAAAFDTRMQGPPAFTGRASKGIAKRLRHHGYDLVADPESFLVTKENELVADEEGHARRWGEQLAAVLVS
jgi:hypothetical protein